MLRGRSVLGLVVCLTVAAGAPSHEIDPVEPADAAGGIVGAKVRCEDGFAERFPCRNVDLLAWLSLEDFDLGNGNDIWGWTDPETGSEIAIMGFQKGTAFVDVSDPERPIHVATLLSQTRDSLWRDIKVYDGHAFVVSEARDHGMQVLDLRELRDITDPPATLSATVHYAGFGNAHNLAIDEETGFA